MTEAAIEDRINASFAPLLARPDLGGLAGSHILATGCTGFVGAWLWRAVARLNARRADIRVTAISRDPAAFLRRHPVLANQRWLSVLRTPPPSIDTTARPDFVIIGAAPARPEDQGGPDRIIADQIAASRELLALASRSGSRRILCLSSGAVLTRHANPRLPDHSLDAYACGKRAMELMAEHSTGNGGPPVIIARLFSFCGPWLPAHLALSQFLRTAVAGRRLQLSGDGSALRSYLFGADLAIWLLVLLARTTDGGVFEIGAPHGMTLLALARRISESFGLPEPEVLGIAPPDPRPAYVPELDATLRRFDLANWTSLDDAISLQADWLAAGSDR